MPTVAEVAVEIALAEAAKGVFETANDNRGPRIDEYSLFANRTLGEAWCVKFVYWCYSQAVLRIRGSNPLPRIFAAQPLEAWARHNGKIVDSPALGDILIKEHRHGGLVRGPAAPSGIFPSVEGNTWVNTTYDRRREGVYVLNNERVDRCTFIRFS